MRRVFALALMCLAGAVALTACGGDGKKSSDEESAITCEGDELTGDLGLPANFPKPPELTYVASDREGPTRVVKGYFEGELESAYNDYKEGFEGAGYKILFDELEDEDSEVSYEDPDGKTTGIVALKAECDESDRISVRITNREA